MCIRVDLPLPMLLDTQQFVTQAFSYKLTIMSAEKLPQSQGGLKQLLSDFYKQDCPFNMVPKIHKAKFILAHTYHITLGQENSIKTVVCSDKTCQNYMDFSVL